MEKGRLSSICLAATSYKTRHDAPGKILHQETVPKMMKNKCPRVPYYLYEPRTIIEEGNYKIYWGKTVRTDEEEIHNRPDIIVFNKTNIGGIAVEQRLCNSNVVGSSPAIDNVLVIKYFVVRFSIIDAPSHNLFSRWVIR